VQTNVRNLKTGEQCSHCLVKQQETVSENKKFSGCFKSKCGGIKAAKILNDNPDAFDWYSLEKTTTTALVLMKI
jgi:hypothetical protein